jgi:transmembrane sensor
MDQNEFYKQLVNRYAQNSATENELEIFFQLLKEGKLDTHINDTMIKEVEKVPEVQKVNEIKRTPVRKIRFWTRIAAASVILVLLAGIFYFNRNNTERDNIVKNEKSSPLINDAAPGGNKAILTLANGSKIILNNAKNGALTQQGNTKVVKLDDGKLAYQSGDINAPIAVEYNTVSTPRGGQYQLTLSDGSKVWLNAASAITFPTAFTGKERKVEIKGEAYFEVAHDASKPFQVTVNGMQVQVLGTHFNINAYDDEGEIKTTLLEGSVKVSKGSASRFIKPGEQAIVPTGNDLNIQVQTADVDEAVAWKNGLFHFNNADLQEVMRQLSRWYDVDVVYNGPVPNREFGGEMQRDLRLSQVLELLEKNQVNFKIQGKKIMVMAN